MCPENDLPHAKEPSRRRGIAYAYVRSIECRDDNGKVMDAGVAERQAVGGRVSAAMKKAATIDAIVTAMEELAEADLALTIDDVKPRVDRHSRTVARNWAEAWAAYHAGIVPDFRCLLGGEEMTLPITRDQHAKPSMDRISHNPAVCGWPGGYHYPLERTDLIRGPATEMALPLFEPQRHGSGMSATKISPLLASDRHDGMSGRRRTRDENE